MNGSNDTIHVLIPSKGENEAVTEVKVFHPTELHRWLSYPFVTQTGICDFVLWPGDKFTKGMSSSMLYQPTEYFYQPTGNFSASSIHSLICFICYIYVFC